MREESRCLIPRLAFQRNIINVLFWIARRLRFLIRLPKSMTSLLFTLAGLYVALMVLLLVFERSFIFFPQIGRMSGDWNPRGLDVEDVWLNTEDGVRIHSWWIPAEEPGPAQHTILAFHGNAANLPNRADIFALF